MLHALIVLALASAVPAVQENASPYAGQEGRAIKALGPEDVAAYREGSGMGLARAAELNGYPGPKHVLELAGALRLAEAERATAQGIYDRMHAEAVRLGAAILVEEEGLDRLFARGQIDEAQLRESVLRIGRLQGELRGVHLRAHLEMRQALRPDQVERYDRLRGYGGHGRSGHGHPERLP